MPPSGSAATNRRRPPAWRCSGGGAVFGGSAAKAGELDGSGDVGLVERADVGAGRDDLVDAVEDVVAERDVDAGEQIVEVAHGARSDECAGDGGVGDGEGIARWVIGRPACS